MWQPGWTYMLSERKLATKDQVLYDFSLYEMSRIGKSAETEGRTVVA